MKMPLGKLSIPSDSLSQPKASFIPWAGELSPGKLPIGVELG